MHIRVIRLRIIIPLRSIQSKQHQRIRMSAREIRHTSVSLHLTKQSPLGNEHGISYSRPQFQMLNKGLNRRSSKRNHPQSWKSQECTEHKV